MKTFLLGLHAPLSTLAPKLVLLAALSTPVHAEEAVPAGKQLPLVVVTAGRVASRVDRTVAETTVIDREEIEQAAGRSLPELLAREPGLQFSASGGLGKISSLSIRGLESRHTLVLVDGVRFGSATAGTPLLDNIPLEEIERIEIVRGPMSSLYGSDAVGGVIQVFTRKDREGPRGNAAATRGSHRYLRGTGGVSFGDGTWSGAMQLSHVENRGFSATNERAQFGNFDADADPFTQNAGSARLNVQLSGDWRASATLVESNSKSRFDDGPGTDSLGSARTQVASVQLSGSQLPGWRSVTRVGRSFDASATLASASPYTELGAFTTVQQQLSREDIIDTRAGTLLLLAEHLKQKVGKPGEAFDASQRSILGFAAGLNGEEGPHTWQANLRHDRNSQFGRQSTGAFGYGHDLARAWRIAASAGTSFVSPSFNQLYYPGFGNPDLLPEEGRSAEMSLRYEAAGHQLRAALYRHRIRGYISSGPNPTNVPRTQVDGFTLSHEARIGAWELQSSFDYLDPRNRTPGANDGKHLPRRSRQAFRADAEGEVGRWRMGAALAAFSGRYDDAANTLRTAGYVTVDLRADWRFARGWSLGASIHNLADTRYETAYGYNQPGRELYATLRFSEP